MAFVGSLADRVVVLDRGQRHRRRHACGGARERARRRGLPGVGDAVTLLAVDDVVVRYGQAVAVDGVSLEVAARERVALIGPNGAGKTSVLNAACGVVRPASGRVRIEADDVTGATPAAVVRRGISQVPEGRHVFATLPGRGEPPAGGVRSGVQPRDRLVDAAVRPQQGRGARAARTGLHPAAAAPRASRSPGGTDLGRAAADGRDRPRAHGRATAAGHRRALARARAAARAAARRVPAAAERGGRGRDPPRGPERVARVLAVRTGVRPRDRTRRARGREP